jgi:hypothetical protein
MYRLSGDTSKTPKNTTGESWGWLKALIPDLNINVPANIGIDVKTPEKVSVDIFSSVRKNLLPVAAVIIGASGLVVALAYAVRPRRV